MASVFKRGQTWWIKYYVGGQKISRSLKTKSERVARDHKKTYDALEVTGQLPQQSNTPIQPFLQRYCEYLLATCARKGAKNDISYLRGFFGPIVKALQLGSHVPRKYRSLDGEAKPAEDRLKDRHMPVKKLEDISTEMVSAYIHRRIVEDGISAKTANRIRGVLHRMFTYATETHGYVCPDQRFKNPVEPVKPMKERAPTISWLDSAAIAKQLKAVKAEPTVHAMVATYIYAGLRREEATWLTPADVDFEQRVLRVRAKTIGSQTWQPKTRRNRVVPISEQLLKILEQYDRQQSEGRTWFFSSPAGGRWDPDNFSQRLRELNQAAGLSWSCLDFRHTFGSHLAQKGVSLYKIAELMGNSPEICRRHYAALIPEKMHDVVEFEAGDDGKAQHADDAEDDSPAERRKAVPEESDDRAKPDDQPRLRLVR
jgi:integrase